MGYGEPAFSSAEIEADLKREEEQRRELEHKLQHGFFQDGKTRNIVITDISKEEKISQKNNPYTLHTYMLKDVDTNEEEQVVDRDFAVTQALGPVKKQLGTDLRLGVTVLSIATVKSGEREWNGIHYPKYAHVIELVSNPIDKLVAAKNGEEAVAVGSIPF